MEIETVETVEIIANTMFAALTVILIYAGGRSLIRCFRENL